MTDTTTREPLSRDELAAALGVHVRTVDNMRKDGRIPQEYIVPNPRYKTDRFIKFQPGLVEWLNQVDV